MNDERRKSIKSAVTLLQQVKEIIEVVLEEEEEALDNIPESFQSTERYAQSEASIDVLETAKDSIDESISELEDL
jgi:histidinol dehydrogenase